MASSKWKTWEELKTINQTRKIVFWGASNWIEGTNDVVYLNAEYIVDNSKLNQGIQFLGLDIKAPSILKDITEEKPYVIITTSNYMSVIDEIETFGYVMGDDYCCTPLLNERKNKDDLKSLNKNILLSSPTHHATKTKGGGLYTVNTLSGKTEKVASGKGRGLAYTDDFIYWVDMLRGLVILGHEYKEQDVIPLQPNSEPHGICYDAHNHMAYVCQPGRDAVAVYDVQSKKLVDEIFISNKWEKNQKDNHHINDIYIKDDILFITMFSFSGNWMNEAYDGGVLEIDIKSGKIVGPVVSELWMPHSVTRHNSKLMYLDSMRGELKTMNWTTLGQFPSFVRGLDCDDKYYYIGASEHRYPEKLKGMSNNISLDSGFYVFDAESKMSRFFPLSETDSIHSLIVLPD